MASVQHDFDVVHDKQPPVPSKAAYHRHPDAQKQAR